MNRLMLAWSAIRASLWFVPSLIVIGCVALAVALIELEPWLDSDAAERLPRLFGAQAEGTRGMLTAIAASMITVAGVVFSVTIVALSLTASQYSSRVLRNFMDDRTNQVVLGAFVGIYAYCLVVLRTIRGGDAEPFVPSLATLAAIVLAFIGIALLIQFIHHISLAIQATRILAAIHAETRRTIDRIFPDEIEMRDASDAGDGRPPGRDIVDAHCVAAQRTGYIQSIDSDRLLALACERGSVVRLLHRIGDFVIEGDPLAHLDRRGRSSGDMDAAVRRAFTIGERRTIDQDVGYGVRQLVDVALKALSPAINDPTTATMCIDYLSALLVALARRKFPSADRYAEGTLRVSGPAATFATLLGDAFEDIRYAARDQPPVLHRLATALSTIASAAYGERLAAVLAELPKVEESVAQVEDDGWRRRLRDVVDRTRAAHESRIVDRGSSHDARSDRPPEDR